MWVKICGVRTVDQARHAQRCGASAIGVNLHAPSVRSVSVERAAEIAAAVSIESVLVVVDRSEEELGELVDAIQPTMVQLHGAEPPGFGAWLGVHLLKAFRARPGVQEEIAAWAARRILLDAYVPDQHGGTGRTVDAELAAAIARDHELVLAGGLRPDNVRGWIERVQPWGVDVASGVEAAPGAQDPAKVEAFIQAAHAAIRR